MISAIKRIFSTSEAPDLVARQFNYENEWEQFEGHELDIDPYKPEVENKSMRKKLMIDGVYLVDMCKKYKIPYGTAYWRLEQGMSFEEVFLVRKHKRGPKT